MGSRGKPDSSRNDFSNAAGQAVGRSLLNPTPSEDETAAASFPLLVEEFKLQLSRDLHDDCGHLVTLLQLRLAHLQAELPTERFDLNVQVGELSDLVTELCSRLRALCVDLRTPFPVEGIINALHRLIAGAAELMPELQILLSVPEKDGHWPGALQETLYRVCQEALTNAMRHANARQVSLELQENQDSISLTIRDDGQGFVPAVTKLGSLGLTGMRERLELLGGSLKIESRLGQGTVIRAQVPLRSEASHE
jgi:signal transduction histidine kinase